MPQISNGLKTALNDVIANASSRFQKAVTSIETDTTIESFAQPLLNTPALMNEFTDVLVQRIVYTQFETKVFNNPLKVLEGERLPLGYLGQEIFTNPAQGRDYDINDFAGALKKYETDTKVQYTYINFDKQYPVTIVRQKMKQAFVSWSALEEYISSITNSLYNGYYIDEYRATKNIVTNAYRSNAVQIEVIDALTTADKAKAFVKRARTLFLNFQTPSSDYNAWGKIGGYGREIITFTAPEDIVFLIRNDVRSELDVDVLANAFNMDKSTLIGNILPVDNFDLYNEKQELIFDGSKILGIICDKAWFRIKEQDLYMDDFRNANNRSINYYLNATKMFNYSYFANAVIFATAETETAITGLDFAKPNGVTVAKEESTDITINVTPYQANTPVITYESSDTDVATVVADENDDRKITITGVAEGTAVITATAGNVTTTLNVTVTASE